MILCLILTITVVAPATGEEIPSPKIAILVSRNIKPYLEAVEGINVMTDEAWRKESLHSDAGQNLSLGSAPVLEVFSLERFKDKSREILKKTLIMEGFGLFIAVGPEALYFVSQMSDYAIANPTYGGTEIRNLTPAIIYTMVLNPEEIAENSDRLCGIPLRIPIQSQTLEITRSLPCLKRLGLLYDPIYNALFFKEASENGASSDLNIIPLQVASKKEISMILQKHWNQIDSLWIIPDRTVISESIIQYIIKEAVLNRVPVIGYNRFFYDSGAALAFVFDYEQIGRQTAKLALRVLAEKYCRNEVPEFQTWVNSRVIKKLGIQTHPSGCRGERAE